MRKNLMSLILIFLITSGHGCALLLAGAVGGAGTAVWLSNKLVQEVDASFDESMKAAKSALKKLELDIIQETKNDDVAQFISEYYDGKKVWVDIHRMTQKTSRIEVRVGITGEEAASRKILDQILAYL